ncbi:hypothetical protein DRQ25_07830 [Candidatus Fermentibacteria bacterium]|nr:MAG: hypothetical protein DRQ25_07830 [Candidatus Fermentibacteria bacterium]
MPLDIKLGETSHDLEFENFDLSLVKDLDYLIQKVKIKLMMFYKEWFLDTKVGMDYFNVIFGKKRNLNMIDNLIILTITEVKEVTEILEYSSEFDRASRKLTVTFKADSIYGTFSLDEGLTI